MAFAERRARFPGAHCAAATPAAWPSWFWTDQHHLLPQPQKDFSVKLAQVLETKVLLNSCLPEGSKGPRANTNWPFKAPKWSSQLTPVFSALLLSQPAGWLALVLLSCWQFQHWCWKARWITYRTTLDSLVPSNADTVLAAIDSDGLDMLTWTIGGYSNSCCKVSWWA